MMVEVIKKNTGYEVVFPTGKVPSVFPHVDNKVFLKTPEEVESLVEYGFRFFYEGEVTDSILVTGNKRKPLKTINNMPELVMENGELMGFQKEGVRFLYETRGRCLLGDEMGLGKTAQAIAWMFYHKNPLPVLVVCPATLKSNWRNEINRWTGNHYSVSILTGRTPNAKLPKSDIYIVNYDIVSSWVPFVKKRQIKTIFLDECHAIRNRSSQRTKAVMGLKDTRYFIAMSGTPIVSRPAEFWTVLHCLDAEAFPSWMKFAIRYSYIKKNPYGGFITKGGRNLDELNMLLKNYMIRRKKMDVLKQLPAKRRTIIPLEINAVDLEDHRHNVERTAEDINVLRQSGERDGMLFLSMVEKLKQHAVECKMSQAIAWIREYVEQGEKLIIFATHHKTIDTLQSHFSSISCVIDGRVPVHKRGDIVHEYQNNKNKLLFIGNIKACREGITLTASSTVVFLELDWTPADHLQAEDRAHRIGQTDAVNVYYLVAENTIEDEICRVLDSKMKIISNVLDGKSNTHDLFSDVIKMFKPKKQQTQSKQKGKK
jgi:SWI/SNF-related matrix-associated actin-dependent regulator 1 of chromatin subfamily A